MERELIKKATAFRKRHDKTEGLTVGQLHTIKRMSEGDSFKMYCLMYDLAFMNGYNAGNAAAKSRQDS